MLLFLDSQEPNDQYIGTWPINSTTRSMRGKPSTYSALSQAQRWRRKQVYNMKAEEIKFLPPFGPSHL